MRCCGIRKTPTTYSLDYKLRLQVVALCEKKRDPAPRHIVVDTPGQIEIFTWSASGAIITEAFASSFPTCVAFVLDTPRCLHPQTFMSNMLQVGCSAHRVRSYNIW